MDPSLCTVGGYTRSAKCGYAKKVRHVLSRHHYGVERRRGAVLGGGGLAVNLYGVPRMTEDIDEIVATDKDNVAKIIAAPQKLGFVPQLPVDPMALADDNVRAD